MQHASSARIEPAVLSWALERAEVSRSDLATAAGTSERVVDAWLDGRRQPSFRQAQSAAGRLRLPFGFLFLPEPPPDDLPIPDFRTVGGEPVGSISVDLRDVVLATLRRQAWLSEYLADSGAKPVEIVGRAGSDSSPAAIAQDIRSSLNLQAADRPSRSDEAFRDLVRRVESLGVSVLRSGIVGNNTHRALDVNDFRGFALSDSFAPFIFINTVDAQVAQSFTLIHELAHIWRGDTGVSGAVEESSLRVEAVCNRIAAEVLVPAAEFLRSWDPSAPLAEVIQATARRFRVSRYVIAIRAFESDLIERDQLETLLAEYRASSPQRGLTPGGDFYRTLISRNGRQFTEGVVEAVGRQRVLIRDAAALLETRPGLLPRLAREVGGSD